MLAKHAIHSWRNRIVTLVQLLLPAIFTVFACVIILTVPIKETDPPALWLSLDHFDEPAVPYADVGPGSVVRQLANSYSEVAARYGQPVAIGAGNVDEYLLEIADRSLDDYRRRYFVAATVNGTDGLRLTGHFNNFGLHSIAISLSLVDNAILHFAGSDRYRIEATNHPLPRSANTRTNDAATDAAQTAFMFSYMVSFGMAFLVGSFVVFIVNQRASNAKHSQFVSGVDAAGFWLAAFIWDLVSFAVPSILIVIIVLAFQTDSYSEWPVFGCVQTTEFL